MTALRIKEVSTDRPLDSFSAGQTRLAEYRRQAALYTSFQKLRDFVRDVSEREDFYANLDRGTENLMREILREAEGF